MTEHFCLMLQSDPKFTNLWTLCGPLGQSSWLPSGAPACVLLEEWVLFCDLKVGPNNGAPVMTVPRGHSWPTGVPTGTPCPLQGEARKGFFFF